MMYDLGSNNAVEIANKRAHLAIKKLWYNIVTTHTKHGAFAFLDAVYHNKNVMGKQPLSFGQCPVVCVVTTAKTKGAVCMSTMKASTEDLVYSYQVLKMSTTDIAKKYGMCSASVRQRLKKHIKMRTSSETTSINGKLKGKNHPNWRGGKAKSGGYIEIRKYGEKRMFEHRIVMEEILGRKLLPGEVVHHIDGNKENNSPENLALFQSPADHSRFHSLKKDGRK